MVLAVDVIDKYLRPNNASSSSGPDHHLWIPDKEHGFLRATIKNQGDDGSALAVELDDHSVVAIPDLHESCCQVRRVDRCFALPCDASRNDRCEDMAGMNELNEATVLNNLQRRYHSNLIYTYSGLFLVAINPYRNLPIYSQEAIDWFKNKSRNERPPHIYAVADAAYRAMLESRQNQSILITGESGAGKTENTKWVIQYLTSAAGGTRAEGARELEQQIIQTNPILEAFGNAQTIRNSNSSRFGKFVKIEFNQGGLITGANIERYLLEKSRVTHRNQKERSFHIFYQFLAGASAELKKALLINGGPESFAYTKISNATIDEVDDKAEFAMLLKAMDVLGFAKEEQESYFRVLAGILHLGNLAFEEDKQSQAKIADLDRLDTVCAVLGVPRDKFMVALLNPVMKAGNEMVSQARDVLQVGNSVEALARALYERMFAHIVQRINQTIDRAKIAKPTTFIGVLDIAGFEIFQKNSFEQLCINHTNEKLQQFFNHHMFVIEQEEYKRENIEWDFIDFGLDLQPTIDLIDKSNPIGILACLDEDCVVPKSTDKSFCDKLALLWKGKSAKFEPTKFGDGFTIQHYAGKVSYLTDGWLEKNKDPLNENLTRLLAHSSHPIVSSLFADYFGDDEEIYQAARGTRKGLFRTVAQKHRESLTLLMQTLYGTRPHFVRCIVPNEEKRPGIIEPHLLLDQLRCNGVLEGIRICRQGFPNRLPFSDFCRLYEILATDPLPTESRDACRKLLALLGRQEGKTHCIGQTKVFFKAGELTLLDDQRDKRLNAILRSFQARCRGALARRSKLRLARQQAAISVIQRNAKLFVKLRQWDWWRLYSKVKPLLNVTRAESRIEELEEEIERITDDRRVQTAQLRSDLETERNKLYEIETRRRELERENQQLQIQLAEASESKAALLERRQMQDLELSRLRERISVEFETQKEELCAKLASQLAEQQELRKALEEARLQISGLRSQNEEIEFEKLKLEKGELGARQRAGELEALLEESRRGRKELEIRLQQIEDARRALQEQLEDEAVEQGRRRQIQAEYELQLRAIKVQHEQTIQLMRDDMLVIQRRHERETKQLNFELEQERGQIAQFRETVKRYESGTDDLTQLQAELRQQSRWKRESEKLEARLKELQKMHQEAQSREDGLHDQLSRAYEQFREQRIRAEDLDEEKVAVERQKKAIEFRLELATEQLREASSAKAVLEKQLVSFQLKAADLENKVADERDNLAIMCEKVRSTESKVKIAEAELENERKRAEMLLEERDSLEKELRLKVVELESCQRNEGQLGSGRRGHASLTQIFAQIESESSEKQALISETRRLERALHDLQHQLAENQRIRITRDEALGKSELSQRKMQTRLDELDRLNGELEVAKRRAERDVAEERDRNERLARELERLKVRIKTETE